MSLQNSIQVGGDHYQSGFQHWDWVQLIKLPYLPAAASKYLTRWRRKGGLQDLEKALHFLNKYLEGEEERRRQEGILTDNFILNNEIGEEEAFILHALNSHNFGNLTHLRDAAVRLFEYVEREKNARELLQSSPR